MQVPATSSASKVDDSDTSMSVLIPGNHDLFTNEPQDLRSLKFTNTKQRGAKNSLSIIYSLIQIRVVYVNH